MLAKVLVTGFEPFDKFDVNVSQTVVEELGLPTKYFSSIDGVEVHTQILSVTYERSEQELLKAVEQIKPHYVLLLGLNSSELTFSLEKIAVNADDTTICDNDDVLREGCKISESGPVAYWSELPLDQIKASMIENNVSVRTSYSAGNFICNHVFYYMRSLSERTGFDFKSGFIHIGPLQADRERWGLGSKGAEMDDVRKGVRIILECLASAHITQQNQHL